MKSNDNPNFAARLKELEDITGWFESEEIDLDQALVKFERGMSLAAELKDHLKTVQNRVEKIKQKFGTAIPALQSEPVEPEPNTAPDLFNQEVG